MIRCAALFAVLAAIVATPYGSSREAEKRQTESLRDKGEFSMSTKLTIQGYFGALQQKKEWEAFLADDMIFTSHTSPIKQVAGKAAYLESTKRFYSGIVSFEVNDLFIDGDKACALTHYELQSPKGDTFTSDVAEVFKVKNGKIVSFAIYFDTAPFPK